MSELPRLQKYLAERGVASRRKAGEMVRMHRVTVNGKLVTEPGFRVDPARDRVAVDGAVVERREPRHRTVMVNKPRGLICAVPRPANKYDGPGEPTVFELLKGVKERLVPVGRLDKNSEGLLLLSNDGDLVLALTHPRFGHRKIYEVMVSGPLNKDLLHVLRAPMLIEGYRTQPAQVRYLRPGEKPGRHLLEFTLKEGRKRQVRQMCEQVGLTVHRLVRVAVGPIELGSLRPGEWRDLSAAEMKALAALVKGRAGRQQPTSA